MNDRGGQIARVDTSDRLSVPVALFRAIGWPWGEVADITAELVQAGLIRLYLAATADPLVQELSRDLVEAAVDPETGFERMQVLHDRYRPLSMYGDGRIRMTKEVAAVLDFELGDRPILYVQPFAAGLEVMTLPFRNRRFERHMMATLRLHLDQPPSGTR